MYIVISASVYSTFKIGSLRGEVDKVYKYIVARLSGQLSRGVEISRVPDGSGCGGGGGGEVNRGK